MGFFIGENMPRKLFTIFHLILALTIGWTSAADESCGDECLTGQTICRQDCYPHIP